MKHFFNVWLRDTADRSTLHLRCLSYNVVRGRWVPDHHKNVSIWLLISRLSSVYCDTLSFGLQARWSGSVQREERSQRILFGITLIQISLDPHENDTPCQSAKWFVSPEMVWLILCVALGSYPDGLVFHPAGYQPPSQYPPSLRPLFTSLHSTGANLQMNEWLNKEMRKMTLEPFPARLSL